MRKQEPKGKITALYERLSHDDGRSDESVSVENQKRILEDYARKNGVDFQSQRNSLNGPRVSAASATRE